MFRISKFKIKCIVLIGIWVMTSCVKYKTADLIVHNARIYTVNETFEVAQAMAINDGVIVAIGKEHEIMNKYRPNRVIDAKTRPIYPGFIDGHCHFLGSGLNGLATDLSGVKSMKELVKLLENQTKNGKTDWLIGYGWNENNWVDSVISIELLNQTFREIPILLWRIDGHSLLVNEKAIEIVNPPFSIVNGIVSEEQIPLFVQAVNYTKKQKKNALRQSQEIFFANGITSVVDAGLTVSEVELIHNMHKANTLLMRMHAMLYFSPKASKMKSIHTGKLQMNSYKVVLDGSVGSQTACFKKPYKGTNSFGKLLMTRDSLRKIAQLAYDKGFQLAVHCIGDSAVKVALEEMSQILQGGNGLAWRIEHAQCVDSTELNFFSKHSILASVQPSHLKDDYKMILQKLKPNQLRNSYRWKSLLDENGIIALGSDYPVASNNPIQTFYQAVTRLKTDSRVKEIKSNEVLTREEALKGITFWNAMATNEYETKGSLEVGKVADFVVLSRDIMKVPDHEITEAKVISTYLGGEAVYVSKN